MIASITGWKLYALSALGGAMSLGAIYGLHLWRVDSVADARVKAAVDACKLDQAQAEVKGWRDYAEADAAADARSRASREAAEARLASIEENMGRIADSAAQNNRAARAAFGDYERQLNDVLEDLGAADCSADSELRDRTRQALSRLRTNYRD